MPHFTGRYIGRYRRYIADISPILVDISGSFVFFFLNFFTCCIFSRFLHMEMSDISVSYRYIVDIRRFFSIFLSNDFCLQKSFREGPTHDISTIYCDIFVLAYNKGEIRI